MPFGFEVDLAQGWAVAQTGSSGMLSETLPLMITNCSSLRIASESWRRKESDGEALHFSWEAANNYLFITFSLSWTLKVADSTNVCMAGSHKWGWNHLKVSTLKNFHGEAPGLQLEQEPHRERERQKKQKPLLPEVFTSREGQRHSKAEGC